MCVFHVTALNRHVLDWSAWINVYILPKATKFGQVREHDSWLPGGSATAALAATFEATDADARW